MEPMPTAADIFDPAVVDNPYPFYAALRREAPVHRLPGTDFHLVSTWELVTEAAQRTDDFSSNLRGVLVNGPRGPERMAMDLDGQVEQVLATADGAKHALHRKVVVRALGRRIRLLETSMRELCANYWDAFAAPGEIDWVDAFADRLPPAILALLLGLPESEVPRLLRSAYDSVELLGGLVPEERLPFLLDSTLGLASYLQEQLESTDPGGEGVLGALAEQCAAGALQVDTAVMVLMQLVGAGAETTAGLIGTAARQLAADPRLADLLREEPDLIDRFLDECLRLESPLRGHYRVVARETELGGVGLEPGSHLLLLWSSANRDEAHYADPTVLDVHRASVRQHLAFGTGTHFCLGSSLARFEATAAVRTLLARTSLIELCPDQPPQWVPSLVVRRHADLRLRFAPA